MIKSLSIVLIMLLLLPPALKLGVWVDFKLNEQYIAQNLCENKEVLGSNCHGKCHLGKQLKKVEEPEQKSSTQPIKVKDLEWVYVLFYTEKTNHLIKKRNAKKFYAWIEESLCSKYLFSIFKPPQFV
ncbi:hypothetical protein ACQ1PL_04910 [Ornithobacterium rhinotracheale]